MPQLQLPIFPQGVTHITNTLAFERAEERITYFYGTLPVFSHEVSDLPSMRMITSQFCENGHTKQAEIVRAFGIPSITVKRSVQRLRKEGVRGFYRGRKPRGPAVLTPPVISEAQALLDEGLAVAEVAKRLEIKHDTLRKAVRAGRLREIPKASLCEEISSKSERSSQDAVAPMGVAATNVPARLAASVGALSEVAPQFEAALDVPSGGVLCALPALLATGLLEGTVKHLKLKPGYYALDSLLMLLAFMALARLKSIEALRRCAPGEWGLLLGLDRVPEVRTLRKKVQQISYGSNPEKWSAALCQFWMHGAPEQAMVLYLDGHVRVYHGDQTRLPKHYTAREKLCLHATVDYWVNAMDGQPFMVINKTVDPGLIAVIETDILPRLESMVPSLPHPEVSNRPAHRFTLVFDREGYSPDFFKRMLEKGIACLSYNKYPGANWSVEEFESQTVTLLGGEAVTMQLAERGTRLSNGLWVREIRKRDESGHQTAILSTDYHSPTLHLAPRMFARWSQENFFKYMREHFGLDRLVDYQTEEITDQTKVVNPGYRALDSQVRGANSKLSRLLAQFGALNIEEAIEADQMARFMAKKAEQHELIEVLQADIAKLKADRKAAPHYILVKDLPESQRFRKLSNLSKHFLDTVKMVAYRAETAMANIVREMMPKQDEARALLRALYETEADLLPDIPNQTLTVRLHHSARVHTDKVIRKLCDELNATETLFPRTSLRLIFKLGSQ
jgi:prepilin-type processing-associated H-X9-DG protein